MLSDENDDMPANTAGNPVPRTPLQIEMMKNGGPYSPSLYSATAPLRKAQKKMADYLHTRQVLAHTKIIQSQLAKAKTHLEHYESSRKSFKADWEGQRRQMDEAVTAARQKIALAREEIPLTEKNARAAKDNVLVRERRQSEAEDALADAKRNAYDAQNRLQRAESRADAAKWVERSAYTSLDSAMDGERDAQNGYDLARECWLPYHNRLNDAKSGRDDAAKNRADAESQMAAARLKREGSRLEQDLIMMRIKAAGDAEHDVQLAKTDMENARSAEQKASDMEEAAEKQMRACDANIRDAKAEMEKVRVPERETLEAMNAAEAILREARNRTSEAEAVLGEARRARKAAQKTKEDAQKALDNARDAQKDAEAKADMAKDDTQKAKAMLQDAQHEMPPAEVLESARRDLYMAVQDLESAKRRYNMAGRCATAADKKKESAELLRAAEEAHLKDGKERWDAEGHTLTALEQIKARDPWVQERLTYAKKMREVAEGLRSVIDRRTNAIQNHAEYDVQLAGEWMSQAQAALDSAKERRAVMARWLDDARKEGWPDSGAGWSDIDGDSLAAERGAVENARVLMDEHTREYMQWVERMQRDARDCDAMVKGREAEEAEAADMRMRYDKSVRDANRTYGMILESLERVPEPGRTGANMDVYFNGVKAAKRYKAKQGDNISSSSEYRNFMGEHPEVCQGISSGHMGGIMLDALDATLTSMDSERSQISRDAEAGVTPSMCRWTSFREGTLALAGQHLILYDNDDLKELERIPLNSIKKCDAGLLRPALNIETADAKKKFQLPMEFAAGHSESDEYKIWSHLIGSQKTGGRGMLHVQTVPPGALVLVNGLPYGVTPLTLEKPITDKPIIRKKYEVHVLLEGYEPKNKTVGLKDFKVDEEMKRLKKADPTTDTAVKEYRKQVPGGSATSLFVTEDSLNGENGTSLVLSRDSVLVLSANRRILFSMPYGALEDAKTYRNWMRMWGLKVTYRQAGKLLIVKFAADKKARSKCGEIKDKLKEKMREFSDGKIPDITRLPRLGYTFLND